MYVFLYLLIVTPSSVGKALQQLDFLFIKLLVLRSTVWSYHCCFVRLVILRVCCFPDVWLTISQQHNATTNITNRGVVHLAALGTLLCKTVYHPCCSTVGQGGWYYPNGSAVPPTSSGATLFTSRSSQGYIALNQRNNFSENSLNVDGVYSCEVPDASGTNETLYVGIYSGPVCKLPFSINLHIKAASKFQLLISPLKGMSRIWDTQLYMWLRFCYLCFHAYAFVTVMQYVSQKGYIFMYEPSYSGAVHGYI